MARKTITAMHTFIERTAGGEAKAPHLVVNYSDGSSIHHADLDAASIAAEIAAWLVAEGLE